MGAVIGVFIGYVLGTRAGPEGWVELKRSLKVIASSDEAKDIVATGFSVVRDLLGRGSEILIRCARRREWLRAAPGGVAHGHALCRRVPRPVGVPRPRGSDHLMAGDDEFKFMEVCAAHTHTIYRQRHRAHPPGLGRAGSRARAARCVSSRWAGSTTPSRWPRSQASSSPPSET